jgi:predicted dehydrogenase
MLKAGLYGFGGIAQAHKMAYEKLAAGGVPVQLVAACDIDPKRFESKAKINIDFKSDAKEVTINTYPCIEDMLAKEELDIVDICLPTFLHADAAVEMLKRGYHVISEKPMALNRGECEKMLDAERTYKGKLMIGQCMRFRREYLYVKDLIDNNTYGKVISAYFNRLSNPPIWAWDNWFMDPARSGGCMLDMHIHDADMVRFLFGEPSSVSCASRDLQSKYDSNFTRFIFGDGKTVVAVGDWSHPPHLNFHQEYRLAFEKATVVYDGTANTVLLYEGQNKPVQPVTPDDGMAEEIRFFVDLIINGGENTRNAPRDSAGTIHLIEKMRESAERGGEAVAL